MGEALRWLSRSCHVRLNNIDAMKKQSNHLLAVLLSFAIALCAITPAFATADQATSTNMPAARCQRGSIPKGNTCISARRAAQDIVALAR